MNGKLTVRRYKPEGTEKKIKEEYPD